MVPDEEPEDKEKWGQGFALRATSKNRPPTPPSCPPPAHKKRKYDKSDMPDWATFENDPTAWRQELNHIGVDEHAQKLLYCLAQHNEAGKTGANNVIWHAKNNNYGKLHTFKNATTPRSMSHNMRYYIWLHDMLK